MADQGKLPVVSDCSGCGVCCFHMGYPAFILPRKPMTQDEIDSDERLAKKARANPAFLQELLDGRPGESYWHALPEDLRADWVAFVESYQTPEYGDSVDTFDKACIWFDMNSRQCRHHQYRPQVCRDFEAGSKQCQEWRNHYRDQIRLQ